MSEDADSLSRRDFVRTTAAAALASPLVGCGAESAHSPVATTLNLPPVESDADVEALLPKLSNWGRWGAEDRLGTLNFITPQRRRVAAALVRSGQAISLARQSAIPDIERGEHEVMLRPMGSRDFVGMVFHGFEMTHLDALCHVFADQERMYNGHSRGAVTTEGARELGVEAMGVEGIVGRGVLLDVGATNAGAPGGSLEPGTPIYARDLAAAEAHHGVMVGSGDLLFVRTGAGRANTRERRSGLHPECLVWLREREVALLAGDGDSDVAPLDGFERWGSCMHTVAIPYMGLPLIDNADLEAIAVACTEHGRWAFLAAVAPLRVQGLTGSAVNPIALL